MAAPYVFLELLVAAAPYLVKYWEESTRGKKRRRGKKRKRR